MKQLLAILLTAAMLCSFVCTVASAEEPADIDIIEEAPIFEEAPLSEDEAPPDDVMAEALAYIAQVQGIFNSGTFTLKAVKRIAGPINEDQTGPQVWIYDRANYQKLFEFDKAFFTSVVTESNGFVFDVFAFLGQSLAAAFRGVVGFALGPRIRTFQIKTAKYLVLPERSVCSGDLSRIPITPGFYDNFNEVIDCRVTSSDVVEAAREGSRVRLLCADGREYVFEDGIFVFYGRSWPSGAVTEWTIESLSPEADLSYFSTEGMTKISLDWLRDLFSGVRNVLFTAMLVVQFIMVFGIPILILSPLLIYRYFFTEG